MKKLFYLLTIATIVSACGTSKETTNAKEASEAEVMEFTIKAAPAVPEGLSFEKVEYASNKMLASINMPVSGSKFSVKTSDTPEGRSIYKFGNVQLLVYAPINKEFEGPLDEQLAKIRNDKYFGPRTAAIKFNENHIVDINKGTVADYDVVKVDISRKLVQGWGSFNYGYLVQHGSDALFIWIKDVYVTPDDNQTELKKTIDDAMRYMIETIEFK